LGSIGRTLGDIGKAPKMFFFLVMKKIKKDIMGVKNINVLKLMKSDILKLMKMKMKIISWAIYMIMDYQFFDNQLSFK
jgi:hypothetical protein